MSHPGESGSVTNPRLPSTAFEAHLDVRGHRLLEVTDEAVSMKRRKLNDVSEVNCSTLDGSLKLGYGSSGGTKLEITSTGVEMGVGVNMVQDAVPTAWNHLCNKEYVDMQNLYNPTIRGISNGEVFDTANIFASDIGQPLSTGTQGLIWTGRNYIRLSQSDKTIYFYDGNFNPCSNEFGESSKTLTDDVATFVGMAWDGRYIWASKNINAGNSILQAYDISSGAGTAVLITGYSIPASYCIGYANDLLYYVSHLAKKLVAVRWLGGSSFETVYTSSNTTDSLLTMQALTFDGCKLWAWGADTLKVYSYALDCTVLNGGVGFPYSFGAVSGATWNGRNVAVISGTTAKIISTKNKIIYSNEVEVKGGSTVLANGAGTFTLDVNGSGDGRLSASSGCVCLLNNNRLNIQNGRDIAANDQIQSQLRLGYKVSGTYPQYIGTTHGGAGTSNKILFKTCTGESTSYQAATTGLTIQEGQCKQSNAPGAPEDLCNMTYVDAGDVDAVADATSASNTYTDAKLVPASGDPVNITTSGTGSVILEASGTGNVVVNNRLVTPILRLSPTVGYPNPAVPGEVYFKSSDSRLYLCTNDDPVTWAEIALVP